MSRESRKNWLEALWISIIVIGVIILVFCNVNKQDKQPVILPQANGRIVTGTVLGMQHDTIPTVIKLPTVRIAASNLKPIVKWREVATSHAAVEDTASRRIIEQQLYTIDSLRKLVAATNKVVAVTFGCDSVHAITNDTLCLLCDALNSAAYVDWRPSARTIAVPRTTTYVAVKDDAQFGVGLAAGYGLVWVDNRIRDAPFVGIVVYRKLWGF